MSDPSEWWYSVDARSAPVFRMGDRLEAGTIVGFSLGGEPIRVRWAGCVVGIQYDTWLGYLILALESD